MFFPQTHAAQTRRESSLRVFSQDVQIDSFGSGFQKTRIGRLEKTWSPILLIKKQGEDLRDLGYSDKWKLSYNASIKRTLPRPAGNRACGFFSRRPIWTFWPPKNSNWTSWEENLKPHPLNQKTRRRSERSGLFRQMKAIIQRFNQTYAAQTRRESSLRVFSQDVQIGLVLAASKNSNWTPWENLKPHPLNQKTRRRSERSGPFRQMGILKKMKGNWWGKQAPYFGT